ncbi:MULTISPECIES: hypothetical protein [unclassified Helicobacter]|uniref:hypothetical protein n=1 Tax=unclassified Helicobacter TaxID=2593540 RepID=UPI0012E96422|nr:MULTISPECIES: hypothetical protein [unclassified Helicobacter]
MKSRKTLAESRFYKRILLSHDSGKPRFAKSKIFDKNQILPSRDSSKPKILQN